MDRADHDLPLLQTENSMSHGHREFPHQQDRSATAGRAPGPRIAPGKQSLTSRLPPSSAVHAPAQLARDPAAASASAAHAAITREWTPTAMRPDLHPAPVQRKSAADAGEPARTAPSGGGQAMPETVQTRMEGAFATDFSAVRIHEGQQARDMGALAYTQGADIHFAPGQYQPGSQSGQELLGHELAHVVQQSQGRVQATTQAKGVAVNDDPSLEREADEMGARAARGQPAGTTAASIGGQSSPAPLAQMRLAGPVIQRMPAWDSLEKTDNDAYGVEPGSRAKLYGQSDAAAPKPNGLYSATTEDKDDVTYKVWTPNVKFTSKDEQNTIVGNANSAMDLLSGGPEEQEVGGLKMQVVNQFVASLEQTIRDRIDGNDGSATTGVVGPNDCRGWASQLRYMIAMQLGEDDIAEGGEQSDFDLDVDEDVPALSPGDQMTHTFAGEQACSYHSATVVATDPPSVVTLEAHASKDLTAPEFHVRAGLPGFVADNDTTPEGASRGLGKKGQRYDVNKSQPTAQAELHKINQLLAVYDGQDPLFLLQIIQKFKTIS
jgi:hypothetical protein